MTKMWKVTVSRLQAAAAASATMSRVPGWSEAPSHGSHMQVWPLPMVIEAMRLLKGADDYFHKKSTAHSK
jgi:hypothetical protein